MNVLRLADLDAGRRETLLGLSERFGREGIPRARPGRFVCGLFFNPSLRTRTALEIASVALGAHCMVHDVGQGVWKLETRDGAVMDGDRSEHVRDAVGAFLSRVVDLIGVRCFADPALSWAENREDPVLGAVARAARVPVVNLESALWHPMQALADLLVLKRHAVRRVAVTWAWHPRPLPMAVPNSAVVDFARAGHEVRERPGVARDLAAALDDERRALVPPDVGQRLQEGFDFLAVHSSSWRTAAWVRTRACACSETQERGPSMTSSVTTTLRRTGRQCMKPASPARRASTIQSRWRSRRERSAPPPYSATAPHDLA